MDQFQISLILRDFLISHHPGVLDLHQDILIEPHIFKELDKDAQEGILSQLKELLDRKEEGKAETEASTHNQIGLSYPLIYKVRNFEALKPLKISQTLSNLFVQYCKHDKTFSRRFANFSPMIVKTNSAKIGNMLIKAKKATQIN
mgnify:CR=1 FL=1